MDEVNIQHEQLGDNEQQFMTFLLAGEIYGVDILRVREIRGWERATRVPNTPAYMKGVINLRGLIVPVFDLRERFQLGAENHHDAVVIILRVQSAQGEQEMGVIADAVAEVLETDSSMLRVTPEFGGRVDTRFMEGLVPSGERMVMLLNVDKLLGESIEPSADGMAVA